MHPAPSIIAFTTFSGLGFGLLFWLGIDATPPTGFTAFAFYLIGYVLAVGGLLASALHLGRRERALKAFTQWRSSWLSREAWGALAALTITGLHALLLIFGLHIAPLGWLSALLCLGTVFATSMIYAQLKTVPRWHHWTTPALFLLLSVAGGALLSGRVAITGAALVLAGLAQLYVWLDGDKRLARSGTTLATATGLGSIGTPRAFEPPHTGNNYLLREMVYTVARKHALKLRVIALTLMTALPILFLALPFNHILALLAVLAHIAGVLTARWLFFAEAEHVVGLYYGKR
ncbi:dimethyl sulfoxide reductase anchor subunit family protein [Tropicibacter oceani]|uniref:Dimethyl sulfoxide reductase anchor subunit n=1 Tax=Tropicibacter oceani TaxID=3058420 RepID=A0ABY8QIE9_9RHOB|nr:DmsC/YnfH family molybdoenzyme membrane anchor subunit [Tropicibacter oceani]WGW04436.1 dimethyl sulfoxide reductase anchor subunit [Tropicibacter oceani]